MRAASATSLSLMRARGNRTRLTRDSFAGFATFPAMRIRLASLLLAVVASAPAHAWLLDGHQATAAIAWKLSGPRARAELSRLLAGATLEQAAIWADCAKSVNPLKGYAYQPNKSLPECAVFETPDGIAEMVDYVKRNDRQCGPPKGFENCHRQYHYADLSPLRDKYAREYVGTSDHDVVSAMGAAIEMVRNGTAPAPFSFSSRGEALRVLVHLVGDQTQPLHIGSIYLDDSGKPIDPDLGGYGDADTHGGNRILLPGERFHFHWDKTGPGILGDMDRLVYEAAKLPPTKGDIASWPRQWADDSLLVSRQIFAGVNIAAKTGEGTRATWPATLAPDYDVAADRIKIAQIAKAGARLAEIFWALWPD